MASEIDDDPGKRNRKSGLSVFQVVLLIMCALVINTAIQKQPVYLERLLDTDVPTRPSQFSRSSHYNYNPLSIPEGQAQNLPSVRVVNQQLEGERGIYGGKGDASHLGGFTEIDMQGISPAVWKYAVTNWNVKSVLDVGCGKGTSTSWFVTHGLRTQCVEGSHDAIEQNIVPDKSILTEHDFSRGPWWPDQTFDMVWSVEFLEHVNLQFHYNYISSFRKAAILMVTSSFQGGWHHVEVHETDWWVRKYEAYGFRYDEKLTQVMRKIASNEDDSKITFPPNGENFSAQHVWTSMKVFINPTVAALPEHAHLFGEFGCYLDNKTNRECGKPESDQQRHRESAARETPLDPSFYPLRLSQDQDQDWYDIIKANMGTTTTTT